MLTTLLLLIVLMSIVSDAFLGFCGLHVLGLINVSRVVSMRTFAIFLELHLSI